MSRRTWITIVVCAVILLVLMAWCSVGGGGESASAASLPKGAVVSQTKTDFTVTPAASRANGQCWRWTTSWHAYNGFHIVIYKFGLDVEWCANAAQTKVTHLVYNFCYDAGSKWDYDGCHKEHGSLGYASLGMHTTWHYHFGFPAQGIVVHYAPHVRFDLHANGGVTGTVWYK